MIHENNTYASFFLPIALLLFFFICMPLEAGTKYQNHDWFWFLYEYETTPRIDSFVIRPLYLRNVEQDRIYEASLPPVFYWKYQTRRNKDRRWLFGLAADTHYIHSNGVLDYDLGIFPFLYYGDSIEPRDQYLLFWPLGGTIKGKFAQDRISPWIFPGVALFFLYPTTNIYYLALYAVVSFVPVYTEYENGDYSARAILWPLISWGKGSKRETFRLLPFYARHYKKGVYDNRSYLLLFNYRRSFYHGKEQTTFFAFPFLGRRWNSDRYASSSTLLWPFFSWGYNKKNGDYELNFPWPLVQYQRSQDPLIRKSIFFPFYGSYRFNNQRMKFVTPLYFSLFRDSPTFKSEYYVTAFIIWYFKRDYLGKSSEYYGNSWRYFKIWPLFYYEKNDKGDFHFRTLSLLPFRDPDGYEKMYAPFWSLFEYHRSRDGSKKLGILLRTYYQYWGDDFIKIKIPVLFTYGAYNGHIAELSILLSMFGYEWNSDGRYLRLLWIPFKIGEGRKDIAKYDETPKSIDNGLKYVYNTAYDEYVYCFDNETRCVLYKGRIF